MRKSNQLFAYSYVLIILQLIFFAGCSPSESVDLPKNPKDTTKIVLTGNKVYIQRVNDKWQIIRNNAPYFIKGGCSGAGTEAEFKSLHEYGGNSIRNYDINASTMSVLNNASKNDITVMQGIWLLPEEWFDYSNPTTTNKKLEELRTKVNMYKNHPALLAWGISNEVLGQNSSAAMYKFINDVSVMIHKEDSNHLTSIVTAGITTDFANKIAKEIPDIDFIGVNYYAAIHLIAPQILASKFNKPYVVTEWGINGEWEVAKTEWGCPIEPSSRQKSDSFRDRYSYIRDNDANCIGSYAFTWGGIMDWSPTWWGLLYDGKVTEQVDQLTKAWTGSYPANRAPSIVGSKLNDNSSKTDRLISYTTSSTYSQQVTDIEGDALTIEYILQPYEKKDGLINDGLHTMAYYPNIIYNETLTSCKLKFTEKESGTAFRLYIILKDSKGRVSIEVFPFKVI